MVDYYSEGWSFAKGDCEEGENYDPNVFYKSLVMSDKDAEDWVQGYYDYWHSNNRV